MRGPVSHRARHAVRGGAEVSVTGRLDPKVKAAIATIAHDEWTPIEYSDAIFDQVSGTWVSRAEGAFGKRRYDARRKCPPR